MRLKQTRPSFLVLTIADHGSFFLFLPDSGLPELPVVNHTCPDRSMIRTSVEKRNREHNTKLVKIARGTVLPGDQQRLAPTDVDRRDILGSGS